MIGWLTAGIGFGALWFSYRYAWWQPPIAYRYPRILMYHMIRDPIPGARFNGLRVSPAAFEGQLRWLVENGWRTLRMTELIERWGALPEKVVALTFDDGYQDNFWNALPLLEKYDATATVYLVVDRFGRDWSTEKKAHHDSGELGEEPKLTDEQVQAMLSRGCFELGSHTLRHPNFATLSEAEKRMELAESRRILEQRFGVPVRTFAYPFGIFQPSDVDLVREAGYTSAVTTDAGIDVSEKPDLYRLKRVKISGKDNHLAFLLCMRSGRRGWKK